jgi:hypothetical protein
LLGSYSGIAVRQAIAQLILLSTDMPLSLILAMAAVAAYLGAVMTALFFHGVWVAPFIERHGQRSAGFLSIWIFPPTGLIRDYIRARRLCERIGLSPFWMRWFTSALILAGVFAGSSMAVMLFAFGTQ